MLVTVTIVHTASPFCQWLVSSVPLHSPGARSELFITLLLGHFSILFRLIQLVIMEKVLNAYEHIIYISYIWFAATLD